MGVNTRARGQSSPNILLRGIRYKAPNNVTVKKEENYTKLASLLKLSCAVMNC